MAAANALPNLMLCPTESQRGVPGDGGWSNYHANAGSWAHLKGWDGVFGALVHCGRNIKALPPLAIVQRLPTARARPLRWLKSSTACASKSRLRRRQVVIPLRTALNYGGNPVPLAEDRIRSQKFAISF